MVKENNRLSLFIYASVWIAEYIQSLILQFTEQTSV